MERAFKTRVPCSDGSALADVLAGSDGRQPPPLGAAAGKSRFCSNPYNLGTPWRHRFHRPSMYNYVGTESPNIREANEQAIHQRENAHCRPWTLPRSHQCVADILGGNTISNVRQPCRRREIGLTEWEERVVGQLPNHSGELKYSAVTNSDSAGCLRRDACAERPAAGVRDLPASVDSFVPIHGTTFRSQLCLCAFFTPTAHSTNHDPDRYPAIDFYHSLDVNPDRDPAPNLGSTLDAFPIELFQRNAHSYTRAYYR
ncbi:hypothetical protein EVAR_98069_1 [Eumeta japonica]|uniref:Uncharacterized protein n=1 Tax=Eumeta variegata TaxID=151549 RepID=A0A4C1WFI4_EUMVA|nr:hypothetical protein EVAR_98069_1 [Eumeta japonica]